MMDSQCDLTHAVTLMNHHSSWVAKQMPIQHHICCYQSSLTAGLTLDAASGASRSVSFSKLLFMTRPR